MDAQVNDAQPRNDRASQSQHPAGLGSSVALLHQNDQLRQQNDQLRQQIDKLLASNRELLARHAELIGDHHDLSNLFLSAKIPILLLSADLRCRRATPVAAQMLKLSQPPLGQHVAQLFGHFVDDFEAVVRHVAESGESFDQDVMDRDGFWYSLRLRPYVNIAGQIEGAIVALIDIDGQKKFIAELDEAKEYAEAIVDTVSIPLLLLDSELRVVKANYCFHTTFDLDPLLTQGAYISQLRGKCSNPGLGLALEQALRQESKVSDELVDLTFPGSGRRVFKLNARRLACRTRKGAMMLLAIEDVTLSRLAAEEAQHARAVAEEASRAKSDFLANMSHELRTPLGAILGYVEVLSVAEPTRISQEQSLARIGRNVQHLLGIIDEVLDLSKIEAGKLDVNPAPFALLPELAEAMAPLKGRAEAKGLGFAVVFTGAIPEIITSCPLRLRQILLNVVGNALKFTEVGGVTVTIGMCGTEQLRMTVKDSGCGLSREQRQRIFKPFGQGDSSVTRRYGGTGLGLNLSRRLAEALGGTVELAGSAPGLGTTFVVTVATGSLVGVRMLEGLSAQHLVPAANLEPQQCRANKVLAGVRILLAEDGEDNQTLIEHFLTMSGATMALAVNGAEAVRMALSEPFDLIIMDIQMPVVDGYEAVRRLKSQGYSQPIIALTAHAMQGERERCLGVGCVDYLTKPINSKHLIDTVAAYTNKHGVLLAADRPSTAVDLGAPTPHSGSCTPCGDSNPPTPGSDSDGLTPRNASAVSTPRSGSGTPRGDSNAPDALVASFAHRLPLRSAALRQALGSADWEKMKFLAHQLSGAAGGYGFPEVGHFAAAIAEQLNAQPRLAELSQAVAALERLCQRAASKR